MRLSYWERDQWFSSMDIAIAGGGIVGLNTALALKRKRPELKILVIEKGIIPHGASTRNAGFACFGSLSEVLSDFSLQGEERSVELIKKRWQGLKYLRETLGDEAIGFVQSGGYELYTDDPAFEKCSAIIPALNRALEEEIGKDVYRIADGKQQELGLSGVRHLTFTPYEGQVNTGRMMDSLYRMAVREGVKILNGVKVSGFSDLGGKVTLELDNGFSFDSTKLIVATNGFAAELLDLEVKPARAQVLITHPVENLRIRGCFHLDEGYYYFRDVGDRLLFGGGRNLDLSAEETTDTATSEKIQARLDQLLKEIILPGKEYRVDMRWAGIMGIGPEKLPIIRNYSDNVICAVRLGGMGVAIGSLVGRDAADLVLSGL